mmetsp:Transcript_7443/g.15185  ORF Transcript_7443/g.15185 Transcript_7443/m.15185 type:complete len:119 (-) Transcript_7443:1693-2049(-)
MATRFVNKQVDCSESRQCDSQGRGYVALPVLFLRTFPAALISQDDVQLPSREPLFVPETSELPCRCLGYYGGVFKHGTVAKQPIEFPSQRICPQQSTGKVMRRGRETRKKDCDQSEVP